MKHKELSIFIDESGDFGSYNKESPFYLVTFVFHNQDINIKDNIYSINESLKYYSPLTIPIHSGPIIRGEEDYRNEQLKKRIKIFQSFFKFILNLDISYKTFIINKKDYTSKVEMSEALGKLISNFLSDNKDYFLSYKNIKIYYDNGQNELTSRLAFIFSSSLNNYEFKKVKPIDYRLFQVADMICTIELIKTKLLYNEFSKAEKSFFKDKRTFNKNYIKPLKDKDFDYKVNVNK